MYEVTGFRKGEEFFIPTTDIASAIAEVLTIQNQLDDYASYRLVKRNPMTMTIDHVVFEWSRP